MDEVIGVVVFSVVLRGVRLGFLVLIVVCVFFDSVVSSLDVGWYVSLEGFYLREKIMLSICSCRVG